MRKLIREIKELTRSLNKLNEKLKEDEKGSTSND